MGPSHGSRFHRRHFRHRPDSRRRRVVDRRRDRIKPGGDRALSADNYKADQETSRCHRTSNPRCPRATHPARRTVCTGFDGMGHDELGNALRRAHSTGCRPLVYTGIPWRTVCGPVRLARNGYCTRPPSDPSGRTRLSRSRTDRSRRRLASERESCVPPADREWGFLFHPTRVGTPGDPGCRPH